MKRFLLGILIGLCCFAGISEAAQTNTDSNKGKNMKIAVLAANGKSGSLVVKEALEKGFDVSAFVRNSTDRIPQGAKIIKKDIFALTSSDLSGFDVIVDAFGEWKNLDLHKKHMEHLVKILSGNKAKFIVIGGAGSLYMDKSHTTQLMDTPSFPESYKGVAKATADALQVLRDSKDINYIYVSPPATYIYDAPKSGYIIGGEELFTNDKGESKGSYADLAAAVIDLAQHSDKVKVRVSVVSK